jgi:hypothetical protein
MTQCAICNEKAERAGTCDGHHHAFNSTCDQCGEVGACVDCECSKKDELALKTRRSFHSIYDLSSYQNTF